MINLDTCEEMKCVYDLTKNFAKLKKRNIFDIISTGAKQSSQAKSGARGICTQDGALSRQAFIKSLIVK